MRRRTILASVSGIALSLPLAARGQSKPMSVVGFMSTRSPEEAAGHTAAFRQGLGDGGYVDGVNVTVEYRWAHGRYESLPALASELVSRRVTVLVAAGGAPSALAAKAATSVIPIVFLIGDDPVKIGLVASFNRPGGNLTGVTFFTADLGSKRLALLLELAPNARTIGLLLNPDDPGTEAQRNDVEAAADRLGLRLLLQFARSPAELERNFAMLAQEKAAGLVVQNDPLFDSQRDRLIALAARAAIPAIYHIREFPAGGGLMSYGASLVDAYRQVGAQVGQMLKGNKAADMPVVQPTRLELVINLKTAKSLGLAASPLLLARADEVIE
jgi:putative ABC transport system substrate-binding protein